LERAATGIKPAFSAWEAHREVRRDLHKSGKGQLKDIRTHSLLFAGVPCLPLRVAGNCADSASGTRCGTEALLFSGVRAEHVSGRCRAIAFVPLFAVALFAIALFDGSLPGLGVRVNDIVSAAVQG
jgi:hypothetical protein